MQGLSIQRVRSVVQHAMFAILTFGGRFGISLGESLPCLSCPFVSGCGGICFLRLLQSPIGGLGMGFSGFLSDRGLQLILAALAFCVMAAALGPAWCGWACPFGLIQDYAQKLRRLAGIEESRISASGARALAHFKRLFVLIVALMPALITLGLFPSDWALPFCSICPVRPIMTVLTGDLSYLAVDFTNLSLILVSAAMMAFTGLTLAGMFFSNRFFCRICPMSHLIHILRPLFVLRLVKYRSACLGRLSCRSKCPAGLERPVLASAAVISEGGQGETREGEKGCQLCLYCLSGCRTKNSLKLKLGPWTVLSSTGAGLRPNGARVKVLSGITSRLAAWRKRWQL